MKFKALHSNSWNHSRLERLLGELRKKKVLVIGDVGVDRYTIGTVERISPEAPVPIVFVQEEKLKLGLAANVADNVQALGGIPFLVGLVGKDRCAEDLEVLLHAVGIRESHLVVDPGRRTVLKERLVSESQQLLRVDYESVHPVTKGVEAKILKKIAQILPKVDAVILQDYAKGMLSEKLAAAIFALGRKFKKTVAVDPNSKSSISLYRGGAVLTPNTKEAEKLSGVAIRDESSLCEAGRRLLKGSQAEHVVITRGKEGMAIFSRGVREVRIIPTFAREVFDVSGAGDTVISVLTLALSAGASIEEAAILGNLAAGVEVGKRGTATVSRQEIQDALQSVL
jgi:D-beta-D-heptose 7-phosphate kinase/D-beta-D-heptose 1-phosphate adenosyltransferase